MHLFLFSLMCDCVSLTKLLQCLMMTMGGCHFFGIRSFFGKEVMFTFCYCIPNYYSLLNRWKCPFVSLFKQKKKCLPSHLHQKSTYHYYPSFYSDHGCYFFHCFMVNIQAQFYIGMNHLLTCLVVSGWVQRWWFYHILGFRKYKISHIQEIHQEVFALQCHHVHWWLSSHVMFSLLHTDQTNRSILD